MIKFRRDRKGEEEYVAQLEKELRLYKSIVQSFIVAVFVALILAAVWALGAVLGAPTAGAMLGLGLTATIIIG